MVDTVYRVPGVPCSLALLSDFHNRPDPFIINSLRQHSPSLICITGDIVYGSWPKEAVSPFDVQKNVLPFLSACVSIAPTFVSLGNHERELADSDLEVISSTGAVVLDNCWYEHDGVILGGLTSGSVMEFRRTSRGAGTPRGADRARIRNNKPDTAWLEEFSSVPGFHILLSHEPQYLPLVPASVQLVLSGHAHGGQFRLYNPFKREWFGVFAPGQGWWPRYTRGLYDNRLIVSAGLSNTAPVPRLFNPTEVVYIVPAETALI